MIPQKGTYNFAQVLVDEDQEIQAQCKARGVSADLPLAPKGPVADRFGLAFSGGGIRSACVALGTSQSLAKHRLLTQVHYLSGISGGGYFVGWLTAWIKHDGSVQKVEDKLRCNTESGTEPPKPAPPAYNRFLEPETVHHLRRYSSYLTPRMGLFSGDTLAMISIYLRNLLLNQTLLAAALVAITLVLQRTAPSIMWRQRLSTEWFTWDIILVAGFFLIGVVAAAYALKQLDDKGRQQGEVSAWVAYGFGMAACLLTWRITPTFFLLGSIQSLAVFVVVLAVLGFLGSSISARGNQNAINRNPVKITITLAVAWAACAVLTLGIDLGFRHWLRSGSAVFVGDSYVILGYPGILLGMTIVSYLFIGIMGDAFPDDKREWLARIFGYFMASAAAIALVLAIALEGPMLLQWLFDTVRAGGWRGALAAVMPGGWVFLVATGVFGGKSKTTGAATSASASSEDSGGAVLNRLVVAAPPAFLAGVLLLASWGTHKLVISTGASPLGNSTEYLTHYVLSPQAKKPVGSHAQLLQQRFPPAEQAKAAVSTHPVFPWAQGVLGSVLDWGKREVSAHRYWALLLAALVLAAVLALRVDVNEFSMHLFYRNRLVRAFLGASNPSRKASRFTGFAQDDIPLNEFTKEKGYDGPYPLWGTTLNLTAGEDLAWQQRKGASFLYSPLFSGWDYVPSEGSHSATEQGAFDDKLQGDKLLKYGYRTNLPILDQKDKTKVELHGYGGEGGKPFLGTAMAASGAAASPNMGYHTSAGVAALMAIFNVRLGWWTGNPRHPKGWQEYAPSVGYLLKELMGSTNDTKRFVYLSDGGHFENLGIYELVRRRVRFILCSDADADHAFSFQDLGNAVERCRRDFGVEIKIRAGRDIKLGTDPYRTGHYAVGEIKYPGQESLGLLLYIKSSLTDDEPADVLAIRAQHKKFPHDTTGNQFFDETLFEAYRALGEHMMDWVLQDAKVPFDRNTPLANAAPDQRVAQLFEALQKKL